MRSNSKKENYAYACAEAGKKDLERRFAVYYKLLMDFYGEDRLILKAIKLDALSLVRSRQPGKKVLGLQRITGLEVSDYNIHFNIAGGGSVDGPSAGAALFLALYDAVKQVPLCQDLAVSGELSLQGKTKPVGGLAKKLYGARAAGIKRTILPRDYRGELPVGLSELEISCVDDIHALLGQALAEGNGYE